MPTKKERVTGLTPTNPPSNDVSFDVETSEESHDEALITTLTPKMQRFIHLYMTGQYSLNKLAQLLEVHPNTLGKWLKRGDVKDVINDMQETTHDIVAVQLKSLTLKAVNKLSELTESPIDGVALQAVKDILDRAGHKTKQEIKIDKTVRTFEERLTNLIDVTMEEGEIIEEG